MQEVYRELCQAAEQWERLSNSVSSGSDGTAVLPAGPIRDLFEECDAAIRTFAPAAIPTPEQTGTDGGDAGAEGGEADGGGGGRLGAPTGRGEALQQLESIADFFERHDPHSLIGAQIRNVVRLGRLPREAYYRELLRDESALALLFRAAGMDGDESGFGGGGD